ncbi:GntR family transcriptional regulator [Pararhodobacter marinus]|uniref:GntR family transcriptional regulator n=1 Tax=Pararhodobacter marinus TaxID=2184063 RepID=A0A2U2CG11_9RHOB|nr:GntR family transcriptional regulator [Pararhodobacter marinus]
MCFLLFLVGKAKIWACFQEERDFAGIAQQRERGRQLARTTSNPSKSLGEQAYARIRHEIISGVFAPDQPLRLAQLQERCGAGFSPLREALTRLAAEGLVVSESMRGFRVAPLSLDDLRDTMETRIFVEAEALWRSIERGGDEWEMRIVSSLHALGRQNERTQPDDPDSLAALEERHRDFHVALVSASGSRRLEQIIDNLYLGSVRYRMPSLSNMPSNPSRDLMAEHGAISEAALARDAARAVGLLTAHYRLTADVLSLAHSERMARTAGR